ncbi:MAG: hypothetical protein PHP97_01560 [Candidatus Shapirobacteria bacterium]|nr:hypothetical protein [Candidatus Shapirobacteria bacterium]MDD3003084.1 hypothetical protein [Candidatus Shapirobacteria bacterium]MDD4382946.1 hypothetical protein [Candidatus Shapirobacteria bacterium]
MINYESLTIFDKEFKRLFKKYLSLEKDLNVLKDALELFPTGQSNNSEIIYNSEEIKVVKTRLFCRYLKGSTLRLVYVYYPKENKICFLEIYFKGDKVNEDRERIKGYLKEIGVK